MTPDAVVVHPASEGLRGTVRVPGDKSISHRAFLLGAMADGAVAVVGAADSADVAATVSAVRGLGAAVEGPIGDALVRGPLREPSDVLDCGNAGTGMRLLAGVCAGIDGLSVLTGDASLRRRPMERVAGPLRAMGARIEARAGGLAPLAVRGGGLVGREHDSPVASAQVKSAVLLAGLRADGETRVREPGPSRDHTERMLAWLEAEAGVDAGGAWVRRSVLAPRPLRVPGDPSSAAFWAVAAALVPGSDVRVAGVCLNPTRTGFVDVLRSAGAQVEADADREWCGEPVGDLRVGAAAGLGAGPGSGLGAVRVDGDLVVRTIDELPALAVLGSVEVADADELRVKESDRVEGVATLVRALGGSVRTAADGFAVDAAPRGGGRVDSGGDHRIAMAAAVAGLAGSSPVLVTGFACTATSYPSFLDDLAALGGRWELAGG